jgi:transposase
VQQWLAKHLRFHMHFTPTSSSWLNQVERWFRLLADKLLRRGARKSVRQLEKENCGRNPRVTQPTSPTD